MFRYLYLIKKMHIPYTYMQKFQCIRVIEGDKRIPVLAEKYKPIGWSMYIAYSYKPTEQDEIFQIRQKFNQWNDEFEIEDPDNETIGKK